MGRDTSGVKGMSFRDDDYLIKAAVGDAEDDLYVFTVTEQGFAKRTPVADYRVQGRGGLGIKVMKTTDDRGAVAGALLVHEDDEVLVIMTSGKVVRSDVSEVPAKGRDTMGVVFARPDQGDIVLGLARNSERDLGEDAIAVDDDEANTTAADAESAETDNE